MSLCVVWAEAVVARPWVQERDTGPELEGHSVSVVLALHGLPDIVGFVVDNVLLLVVHSVYCKPLETCLVGGQAQVNAQAAGSHWLSVCSVDNPLHDALQLVVPHGSVAPLATAWVSLGVGFAGALELGSLFQLCHQLERGVNYTCTNN